MNRTVIKNFAVWARETLFTAAEEQINKSSVSDVCGEELAYHWFSRIIALRFMEINGFLPEGISVFEDRYDEAQNPDVVFAKNFQKGCEYLCRLMPRIFTAEFQQWQPVLSFSDENGIIRRLMRDIPVEEMDLSGSGQVEIIGWLHQYYNGAPKDETYALLKQNVK